MLNLFKAATILALLFASFSSLFKSTDCASIGNSKYAPLDDSVRSSLNTIKSANSIYSSNDAASPRSKIKRGPIDLDYNQDLAAKFEHPNGLISLNKNEDGQQSASQPLNYRQSKMSRLTSPRTTRIRFLVGDSPAAYGASPQRSEQPDQLISKKPNDAENYLLEPSEPAFLYKRANALEDELDVALLGRKLSGQLSNQLNNQPNSRRQMSYIPSYYNRRLNNDPYDGQASSYADQLTPEQSRRRIKKALSLFAHWKPKETSFLRANDFSSGLNGFDAFNKISPRAPAGSNRRPHGAPLRWG